MKRCGLDAAPLHAYARLGLPEGVDDDATAAADLLEEEAPRLRVDCPHERARALDASEHSAAPSQSSPFRLESPAACVLGSPTVPRTRSEERSYFLIGSAPNFISARIAVGAV